MAIWSSRTFMTSGVKGGLLVPNGVTAFFFCIGEIQPNAWLVPSAVSFSFISSSWLRFQGLYPCTFFHPCLHPYHPDPLDRDQQVADGVMEEKRVVIL
jgi:hypothetical protein